MRLARPAQPPGGGLANVRQPYSAEGKASLVGDFALALAIQLRIADYL